MVEELDNGRQKTRNHGYDVIVGGELFTDYLITLAKTCHAKTQTCNRGGAGRYQLLSRCGMPTGQRVLISKAFEKSDAVALQQIKERGALPMIDR